VDWRSGHREAGLLGMRRGAALFQENSVGIFFPFVKTLLAEAEAEAGETEAALATIDQAIVESAQASRGQLYICRAGATDRHITRSGTGPRLPPRGLAPISIPLAGRSPKNGIVMSDRACGPLGGSLAKAMKKISYDGYRFPPEIIQQAIWRRRP
jgi:hypothetical protein